MAILISSFALGKSTVDGAREQQQTYTSFCQFYQLEAKLD